MKVDIDHTAERDNIILTLHGLNGEVCKVAVPKEDSHNSWVWGDGSSKPFGLNLVYNPDGHHYE